MHRPKTCKGRASRGEKATAPPDSPPGLMQTIARDMKQWFLLLGLGLGAVGGAAAFMGLLVVASMLASIVIVSFTLYLFFILSP